MIKLFSILTNLYYNKIRLLIRCVAQVIYLIDL